MKRRRKHEIPFDDITVIGGSEKWFDAPPRGGIETMRVIMKDG
jgi:hypothetical protein